MTDGSAREDTSRRFAASALIAFAERLLRAAGLTTEMSSAVARTLVEADLLGRTTHGLAMLALYLADIEAGRMARSGEPEVVQDLPSAVTWDGKRLPGPWLVHRAIDLALPRAAAHGVCIVVIRRSHHIGCLAAYLRRVAEQGMAVLLTCSDPTTAGVAPYGGRKGVIRLALRTQVPIVPAVSVGAHETLVVLSRGEGLARRLGLDKRFRVSVMPLVLGPPFGIVPGGIPTFPLPAKVTVELLDPIDFSERFGPEAAEDPEVVDACFEELTSTMQDALYRLAAERQFPVIG